MSAPPRGHEKPPASGDTLMGGKRLAGCTSNRPTLQNAGLEVKPWVWGWPQWVSWLYVNGKGVRK
jgi:hypothetical protein